MSGGILTALHLPGVGHVFIPNGFSEWGSAVGRLLALRCFTEQCTNRDRLISLAATTRRQ